MDTMELENAQEALRWSEERFRSVFETATDAMAISDAEGVVLEANPAYFELYGYTSEEVIGHSFAILFPEESREAVIRMYKAVFNQTQASPYESTIQRKDGVMRVVQARTAFLSQAGQPTAMLSVIRDVTEQKQSEEALHIRYELAAALAQALTLEEVAQNIVEQLTHLLGAEAASIHVYHEADNTFQMLYTNLSLPQKELVAWQRYPADPTLPMIDVVREQKSLWFSSAEEREAVYSSSLLLSDTYPGAMVLLPLVVGGNAFGTFMLTFAEQRVFEERERDLIHPLAHQCAQAVERARLSERTKDLAVVHERERLARDLHDSVNQTLFAANMIAEALPKILRRDPQRAVLLLEQLRAANRGAMAEMRTLLLELRPETLEKASLEELYTQLADSVRGRTGIQVSLKLPIENPGTLPLPVHLAFFRVAQEALNNVMKHSKAQHVTISLALAAGKAEMHVSDDGSGYSAQAERARFGMGSMRERAEAIKATLRIVSSEGKGTQVSLVWPSTETGTLS